MQPTGSSGPISGAHRLHTERKQHTEDHIARKTKLISWESIKVTLPNGRSVTGSFSVSGDTVTVTTPKGQKTTQIGNGHAEALARMMLQELALEGKA